MAPELPPRLVCVDLIFEESTLHGAVEYIEVPGTERLRVRWDVKRQPPGFFPVCGGVAYVEETGRVTRATPGKDVQPSPLGDSRYRWIQGLLPGDRWMMLVLVFPEGFTVEDPQPLPADAKDFRGRLALYWRLKADEFGSTEAEWTLKGLDGSVQSEAERLNALAVKSKKIPKAADADVFVENARRRNGRASNGEKENNGSLSTRMRLLIALIGSPVLVALIGLLYQQCGSHSVQYSGRVVDESTLHVVPKAKVSVDTQPPQIYYTDTDGIFYLSLKAPVNSVHIRVDATGFDVFDRNVSVSRTGVEDVRLTKPAPTPTPTPSSTPLPTPKKQPSNSNDNRIDRIINSRPSNKPR